MKKINLKTLLRARRGQSLVEMGLTIIFLLWLLAGAINFGLGYLSYITIRDAAQEGVTYGVLNPTDLGGIMDRVRNTSSMSATNPSSLVDLSTAVPIVETPGGICPGNIIKVTVNYDFYLLMPFVDMLISNPIHLSAHATAEILKKVSASCP